MDSVPNEHVPGIKQQIEAASRDLSNVLTRMWEERDREQREAEEVLFSASFAGVTVTSHPKDWIALRVAGREPVWIPWERVERITELMRLACITD